MPKVDLEGHTCEICGDRPACDRFRDQYICRKCLNPDPDEDYLEEQEEYYRSIRTSFAMIPVLWKGK